MAILVAGGVVRYAINGSYSGHEVVNILDVHIDGTFGGPGRSDAAERHAGFVLDAWDLRVRPNVSNEYQAISVSWIDLDSEDGSVGVRTSTDDNTWPSAGGASNESFPGNVAVRIDKNTTATRGQRQGRMFLVGLGEGLSSEAQPNMVEPSIAASYNGFFEDFMEDINQDEGVLDDDGYSATIVVVHTKAGEFVNFSDVSSMTVNPYLSSQVRRIRR